MRPTIENIIRLGWRQLILFGAMAYFALLIVQNLVQYQVERHVEMAQMASQSDPPISIPAPRGSILDSAGQPLVMSDTAYKLHADPSILVQQHGTTQRDAVTALMPRLHLDRATLTKLLTYHPGKSGAQYVLLADGLDNGMADAIRNQGLALRDRPGHVERDGRRGRPVLRVP